MATADALTTPPESPGGDFYPLTAADYYQMVDSGILPRDLRVFLWNGGLFTKMAKKQPHAIAQSKLARVLFREIPAEKWYVSTENPVEVAIDKVPLPDLPGQEVVLALKGRAPIVVRVNDILPGAAD